MRGKRYELHSVTDLDGDCLSSHVIDPRGNAMTPYKVVELLNHQHEENARLRADLVGALRSLGAERAEVEHLRGVIAGMAGEE